MYGERRGWQAVWVYQSSERLKRINGDVTLETIICYVYHVSGKRSRVDQKTASAVQCRKERREETKRSNGPTNVDVVR